MDRRQFLKEAAFSTSGGLLGLGAARGLQSGTAAAESSPESIRVGIITEPGGQHLSWFTRALGVLDGVEMVAAADESGGFFEKGREYLGPRASEFQTFKDYRQLIGEVRPHLVLLALEPVHTPPVVEAVLQGGAHVLTDKPGCVRLADFEQVARLAQSKNLELMLGLTNRTSPPARKARELVESGLLGKLYGTSVHLVADHTRLTRPSYWTQWVASRERAGGGKLIYHGIHYLDLVHYIAGDTITEVAGFAEKVGDQPVDLEDSAVLAYRMSQGTVGTLNTGYFLPKGYSTLVKFWGSQGWLQFDLAGGPPMTWYSTHPDAPGKAQSFYYSQEPNTYTLMMEEAVNAARGLGPFPITTRESLNSLRVVFAAYDAAREEASQTVAYSG
jgi:predicted dehydrogenase